MKCPWCGIYDPLVQYDGFVGDVIAMAQSYALEVRKDGRIVLRAPLNHFKIGPYPSRLADGPIISVVDESLDVHLLILDTPEEDTKARNPFFVNDPAKALITMGDQWWQYGFSPQKFYADRYIPRRAGTPVQRETEDPTK